MSEIKTHHDSIMIESNKNVRTRKVKDFLVRCLIWGASFLTIGILLWILIFVFSQGLPHINWEFLTTAPKNNGVNGGVLPMIVNTLYIIILSIGIATPIGVGAAIYLQEYAKPGRIVKIIRFSTETLAGIPSIIYGLFGYVFFVIVLNMGWSLLAGGLTLSIMILPTIVRTTEEAIKAVPQSYREGSLALGASKLRTIMKVVLPSAIPGILAAIILSIGRAVGESAALYFTAGTALSRVIPKSITDSGRTLSVHLYLLAKEAISFEKAYATATVLLITVALINFAANRLGAMLLRKTTSK
ncbi:MAG: phosphate ABC transporter permease PstA [Saccharofermentanales bacterium]|jgi:phosphate transport system permease protein